MALTEQDWKESLKRRPSEQRRTFNEGLLRQAAVDSAKLTGHLAWDKYLQQLQARLEETQQELSTVQSRMATPLTTEQVHLSYVAINVLTERVRVLEECMTLPKQLMEAQASSADVDLRATPASV